MASRELILDCVSSQREFPWDKPVASSVSYQMTTPQPSENKNGKGWQWCALASFAIVILSMVPQIHFWVVRGSQWNGAFTVTQGDELLYSAYVNALIDNRPRRNDPPTGRDDHPQAPLPESLFSIQFIPAYATAIFARILGISASTSFILLLGAEGLLASLSLCWLFTSLTGDKRFAALAIIFVLSFGALAGGHGLFWLILKPDIRAVGLLFLRRYEPGIPFPLSFVFCTLIWKALTASSTRVMIVMGLLSGIVIGVLVYSYFYLWTALFAWLACVALLWLIARRVEMTKVVRILIAVAVPLAIALAPYAYLISRLPATAEKAWVLTLTHELDLLRVPEVVAAFILIVLVIAVRRGRVLLSDPKVIFTASFGLAPFLIFNQQVVTGRSLQPFHYEIFIANYIVLGGLLMLVKVLNLPVRARTAVLLVLVCLSWAAIEVIVPSPIRSNKDVKLDQIVPVLRRLDELAKTDGTLQGLREHGTTSSVVFSPEFGVSRLLPTWAPQGLLTGTGSTVFQGVSQAQRKEWIYLHLYYSGKDYVYFRDVLNNRIDDLYLTYFINSTIFGPERILLFLGWNPKPVSQPEIESEVTQFQNFMRSFSRSNIATRPLTYVITPADGSFDLSRIDQWYERDAGERVGDYVLYRVRLRD